MSQAITNVIETLPAIAAFTPSQGLTTTERRLSAVQQAPHNARLALINETGKVGKAARSGGAAIGFMGVIKDAANADYRSLAFYIAAQTGAAINIPNRAAFEGLPYRFADAAEQARAGKSGGLTKKGQPSSAVKMYERLARECAIVIESVAEIKAAQKAAHEAAAQSAE